jgi:ketosteroid isomerase-like protein
MKKLITVIPLFIILVGCNQAAAPGDPSEITARSAEWDAALNAKDIDALAALYTDDARLMPPNAAMTVGDEGVRAEFGAMIDAGISTKITSIETSVSGNMGQSVGSFEVSAGGAVIDVGKFIETWQRGDDGAWRISNGIYNSDYPPAGSNNEHLVIIHEVNDADHWLAAWRGDDSRRQMFEANGAAHVHTFTNPDNPHQTGLVISVSDMEALNTMLASEEGIAAADADGVRGDTLKVLIEAK